MAIIVTGKLRHSASTRHVSWLRDRTLTRNEALTAMRLAEAIDSDLERGNQRWPHIEGPRGPRPAPRHNGPGEY
jgi:hypothetical protein